MMDIGEVRNVIQGFCQQLRATCPGGQELGQLEGILKDLEDGNCLPEEAIQAATEIFNAKIDAAC